MPSAPPAAAALLAWYDRQRRDLPWRRDTDPYRVWISEIMLQQTRVETVVPYYERFLSRFPDVASLAAAGEDEVLALWSGLGYYRRARQLHAAARQVMTRHDGRFPSTLDGLRSLPGIGPYTAAAVGSIAFGVVEPVMDGNVERVTARLLALDGDAKAKAARTRLLAQAAELLDPARPGDGNQALMELGATVCTPRAPRCPRCPLRRATAGWRGCAAAAQGDPERYPPPRKRRATVNERRLMLVVQRGIGSAGELLLFRRPDDAALLAGTWELPWVELQDGADPSAAAPMLAARYGGRWQTGEELGVVRHGITHRAIEIRVHRGRVEVADGEVAEGGPRGAGRHRDGGRFEPGWFAPADLDGLALSSMVTKALKLTTPGTRRS